jgi:carboxymethylenebutenolidase
MCHDTDSFPPIAADPDAEVDARDLELQAADGTRFAAFSAAPPEPRAGVVILPDIRGLHDFYVELALRFAEHGYAAVVIDYFGRTAGAERRGEDFEYRPHVEQTTHEGVQADVAAAVAHLRPLPVVTVGFCFGGSASWLAAASGHGLAGAVGFYGRPVTGRNGGPAPAERLGDVDVPLLALMGGADEGIPLEDVEAFERALAESGVEHEVQVYPGAPHSFFDRKFAEHADAAADAWRRTLDFIERAAARSPRPTA